MQTKFDVGDEVFVTAKVNQFKVDENGEECYKVALCLDSDLGTDYSETYCWVDANVLMLKKKVGAK